MRSVSGKSVLDARPRAAEPRRFSLLEANRTLPLVRRIVADLQTVYLQARSQHKQLEQVMGTPARWAVEAQLEATIEKLERLEEELRQVGCRVDDYEMGRVVFPGTHAGRPVLLNWSPPEPAIYYFHDPAVGFISRQPVSVLAEQT